MDDEGAASGELAQLRRRAFRPDGVPLTPHEVARYEDLRRARRTAPPRIGDTAPLSVLDTARPPVVEAAPVIAPSAPDTSTRERQEGGPHPPTPSRPRRVLTAVGAAVLAAAAVTATAAAIWPATARPDLVLHESVAVGANDVTELREARVFDLGGAEAVVGANATGERCIELRLNEERAGAGYVANPGYQTCSPPPSAPVLTAPADMSWLLEEAGTDDLRILDRPADTFVTLWPAGTTLDVFFQRDPEVAGGEGS